MLIAALVYAYFVGMLATALFVHAATEGHTTSPRPYKKALFVLGWPGTIPAVFIGALLS